MTEPGAEAWLAAGVLAVDPVGVGGIVLRAAPGPARDAWLAALRGLLPPGSPWRRVPTGADERALAGGLDLAATLAAGRPVAEAGLVAAAHGGVLVLPMAERTAPATAALLAAALDEGVARVERDGIAAVLPARVAIVALDEGVDAEEAVQASLAERLALVAALDPRDARSCPVDAEAVAGARARLDRVAADSAVIEALCATAAALGVHSLRAPLQALRVARAAAALAGRNVVEEEDVAMAARLVLAPRATCLPVPEEPEETPEATSRTEAEGALADRVLDAARAALPPDLLARLEAGPGRRRPGPAGRAGTLRKAVLRGRPAGVRRGDPRRGARLDLLETLRAAVPWQNLRRHGAGPGGNGQRIAVRRDDFRVRRLKERSRSTVIFVVDASGSSAAARMAEAKGAVELLLAECYVRRDQVALVAFAKARAEVLLPPTRALARARRSLAALPGGGGTPLAAGLEAAEELAEATRRRGETPLVVLLSDGRANVDRAGIGGRGGAERDALAAARRSRERGTAALVVDISTRPRGEAARVAEAMGARYVPLPQAGAAAVAAVVRTARAADG